jgi:hypothetical protein
VANTHPTKLGVLKQYLTKCAAFKHQFLDLAILCTLSVDVLELVVERMQHYELCLLSRARNVQALKVSFGSLVPVSPS